MASDRIGDMTLAELKTLIETTIDQRTRGIRQLGGKRSVQEVLDSIDKHRWTPPPGAPSSLELLREDRDR
ncbi:MAG TPA: hypothetical protein VHD90_23590 [Phototrophicaceae bacterium]|nr:hypothetical protein [Phototrophicaceae bacterium]